MATPLVSVIIPVYNCEKYVESSVRSIMNQSYRNLEIIITDDCSTDSSYIILEKLSKEDKRIILIKNNINLKIVKTLNNMIAISNGKYIARMDADDISHINRIEKQVDFLEKHTDYSFCGTQSFFIDENNCYLWKSMLPESYKDIKLFSNYSNPFAHPSILAKSECFKSDNYDEEFLYAEDFHLWKIFLKKYKAANLCERLLYYRILNTSISRNNDSKQKQNFIDAKLSEDLDVNIFKIRKIDALVSLIFYKKYKVRIYYFVAAIIFSFKKAIFWVTKKGRKIDV